MYYKNLIKFYKVGVKARNECVNKMARNDAYINIKFC